MHALDLVLDLVDRGLLDLDASVASLLPGRFPRFPETVTIRRLLTHTSGLREVYNHATA